MPEVKMEPRLNTVKFGISAGIIGTISILALEVFLWIKFVPSYNYLMQTTYGAGGFTTLAVLKIMFISAIISLVAIFLLAWFFAWIYNRLLAIKVK